MLKGKRAVYRHFEGGRGLCAEVARLVADGKVIGWVQGRMEFGPRALGAGAFSATLATARCSA
jgi:carbamoyltransferase